MLPYAWFASRALRTPPDRKIIRPALVVPPQTSAPSLWTPTPLCRPPPSSGRHIACRASHRAGRPAATCLQPLRAAPAAAATARVWRRLALPCRARLTCPAAPASRSTTAPTCTTRGRAPGATSCCWCVALLLAHGAHVRAQLQSGTPDNPLTLVALPALYCHCASTSTSPPCCNQSTLCVPSLPCCSLRRRARTSRLRAGARPASMHPPPRGSSPHVSAPLAAVACGPAPHGVGRVNDRTGSSAQHMQHMPARSGACLARTLLALLTSPPLPAACPATPGAGITASIAWRVLLPTQYAGWREALALLLRLTGLGTGLGVQHVWQLVQTEALPGGCRSRTDISRPPASAWSRRVLKGTCCSVVLFGASSSPVGPRCSIPCGL